jgi:Ca2+-binding EF-hand superfamily protein
MAAQEDRRFNPFAEGRNFPEFSREDIEVFYDGFTAFDTDGDNRLDKNELATALKYMGQAVQKDKLDAFFAKVDSDGSGYIEWVEFLQIMRAFYEIKRKEFEKHYYGVAKQFPEFSRNDIDAFIAAFHEFDADGSGALDVAELANCFKAMGMRFRPEQVHEILKSVDANQSGVVEWDEFLQIMRVLYSAIREEFELEYYGPAKDFKEFSQEDIDAFIIAFREFDVDGSGSLDTQELAAIFRYIGQRCSHAQLLHILDTYDTDRSGTINWIEFLHIMRDFYADALPTESKASAPAAQQQQQTQAPAQKAAPAPAKQEPVKAEPAKTEPAKPAAQPKAAPSSTASSNASSNAAKGANACARCGKTVYPLESLSAAGQIFHKQCFKCQGEGCGLLLTLKTFKGHGTNVYCVRHLPSGLAK